MTTKPKCKACKGKGWILFKDLELQRCDECQKFDGDLSAAAAFFKSGQRKYWLAAITLKPRPEKAKNRTFKCSLRYGVPPPGAVLIVHKDQRK